MEEKVGEFVHLIRLFRQKINLLKIFLCASLKTD